MADRQGPGSGRASRSGADPRRLAAFVRDDPAQLADVPAADDAARVGAARLLAPGHNCWRIANATRMAFLVDGAEYFAAVRSALTKARRSIFILGWDIDSRMRLVPQGADDGYPEPLCDFLNAVVSARRGLRAYVLSWDYAMLYALEREWLPLYKFDWQTHRRLSFRLDDRHPVGASHHQKIVVVDDSVAFVSGFDLTRSRWDTPRHASADPLRVDPAGTRYGPFHDLGAVVEGECARALSELARERWARATRRRPMRGYAEPRRDAWPDGVPAVLCDVPVAIARTSPAQDGHAAIDEIRQLHLDAIAAARRSLYAENQYFTSRTIAEAFAARLARPNAPEIAVVSPATQSGWLEASTMGVLRARIHRELVGVDGARRYRMYCPSLPWLTAEDGCLNIHSKLLIVDDTLLTLGSANLSDRSMRLDTECNLVLEARGDPRIRAAITGFRDRMLAEHLGCEPADVALALERAGSLHGAITALHRDGGRTLKEADPDLDPMVDAVTPGHGVLDPEEPLDPDLIVQELMPHPEHRANVKMRVGALLALVVAFAALALAWRYTGLRQWVEIGALVRYGDWIDAQPLAPLFVAIAFVAGGLLVLPVTLLIAATALVFGPVEGALYSLLGSLLSASVVYGLGRRLGRDAVRRLAGHRLNELSRRLARRGLLAVVLVRVLPVAPFSMINAVAGASHIGWRDFLLGTAVGLAPGIVLTSAFVDRAVAAVQHPSATTFALLGTVAAAILAIVWLVRRRLDRAPAVLPGPATTRAGSGARARA